MRFQYNLPWNNSIVAVSIRFLAVMYAYFFQFHVPNYQEVRMCASTELICQNAIHSRSVARTSGDNIDDIPTTEQ